MSMEIIFAIGIVVIFGTLFVKTKSNNKKDSINDENFKDYCYLYEDMPRENYKVEKLEGQISSPIYKCADGTFIFETTQKTSISLSENNMITVDTLHVYKLSSKGAILDYIKLDNDMRLCAVSDNNTKKEDESITIKNKNSYMPWIENGKNYSKDITSEAFNTPVKICSVNFIKNPMFTSCPESQGKISLDHFVKEKYIRTNFLKIINASGGYNQGIGYLTINDKNFKFKYHDVRQYTQKSYFAPIIVEFLEDFVIIDKVYILKQKIYD